MSASKKPAAKPVNAAEQKNAEAKDGKKNTKTEKKPVLRKLMKFKGAKK